MHPVFDTAPATQAIPIRFATKTTWEAIRDSLSATERQFAQTFGEHVIVEFHIGKNLRTRQEAHRGAAPARRTDFLQRIQRLAEMIFLLELATIALSSKSDTPDRSAAC